MAKFDWDELLEYVDGGTVIPIIGPELLRYNSNQDEVSVEALIAKRLAEKLGVPEQSVSPKSTLHDIIYLHLNGPHFEKNIYTTMNRVMREMATELPIPEPLMKLAEIRPFNLFITTTFDSLMQRALDKVRFNGAAETQTYAYFPRKLEDIPCEKSMLKKPVVYQLMGRVSADPYYVLTDRDVLEFHCALQSKDLRPQLLFDEMRCNRRLLLGHNYPDWLTRFFLSLASFGSENKAEFLASSSVSTDDALKSYLRSFSKFTQIYEDGNAVKFVDELHKRWIHLHPHPTGGTPVPAMNANALNFDEMPEGAVFISYASENLLAARAMHDSLSKYVDVWFDKKNLQGGDAYDAKIKRNVRSCDLFIPLVSTRTEQRDEGYFRKEWRWAAERTEEIADDVAFLVPVIVDDTVESKAKVPEVFRKFQWTVLNGGVPTPEFTQLIVKLLRGRRSRGKRVS